MVHISLTPCIFKEDARRLNSLTDDNIGKVVKALLKYANGENKGTYFPDNPLLTYIFEDLKEHHDLYLKSPETTIPDYDASDDCGCVPGIIASKEEFRQLIADLTKKSAILNDSGRGILKDMLCRSHLRSEDKLQTPFLYRRDMASTAGFNPDEIYPMRAELTGRGVMGVEKRRDERKKFFVNFYTINEPELCKLIHKNVVEEPEIEVSEPVEKSEGAVEPDAELVYSTVTGVKYPELDHKEKVLLYWMNEASKEKGNIIKKGGKQFFCSFNYMQRHISCGSVIKVRQSLVDKGYIQMTRSDKYRGYVYRIVYYPEYLNNGVA